MTKRFATMSESSLIDIVEKFNDGINRRDLTILSELMTDSHTFIDSENNRFEGKTLMLGNWKMFFEKFPDYKNHFVKFYVQDNLVIIIGTSTCSYNELNGAWIWSAKIKDNKIDEWCVYKDTPQTRNRLNIETN